MATIKIKEVELPVGPPKGWAAAVAKAAGVSKKTVYNALQRGLKGPQSNRVLETYKNLYGKPTKVEVEK